MSHDKYSFQKKASSMNGMTRLTGKLLCYSLFLIPLTSSVHTLIPIPLTRVLVLLIFLLLVSYLLKKKSKTSFVLFLIDYLSFVFIYSIFYSISTIQENLEDFIYFSMAILVFVQACDKDFYGLLKKEIDQQKKVFKVIALLTFVINIVGFVLKKGTFESTGAFKGYTIVSHSIATIFVYEMAVFLISREKNILWYVIPLFFVFVSQARTFLIPTVVIVCLYILIAFKKRSTRLLVFIALAAIAVLVFPFTSMYEKFISTSSQWQGLTNARAIFWEADIQSFKNDYSFFEMLFGKGFSWVRSVNRGVTGSRIWAHNDFINVLLSVGILGEVIYFGLIIKVIFQRKTLIGVILLSAYILLPAFINGLYDYFPLVLSIMLLSGLDVINKTEKKESKCLEFSC